MSAQPHVVTRRYDVAPARGRRVWLSDRALFGVIGFVGVLVAWEAASDLGLVKRLLLSAPHLIWQAAVDDFRSGLIYPHIATSLQEWAIGFAIALLLGIPLGLAIGLFRPVESLIGAWLTAVYNTPSVALIPLIILVVGIGIEAKVVVVVLGAIFPVLVSTIAGVKAVESKYLELARSFRATRWLVMRAVILPSTFPFILTGIRVGAGHAVAGVVIAEFLVGSQGVGFYMSFFSGMLDSARIFVGLALFGVFGVFTGEVIRVAERRFDVWRPELR